MATPRAFRPRRGLAALAAGLLAACDVSGADLGFGTEETGTIVVLAYLDRDGSRTPTTLDTLYSGARVALLLKGSGDTLRTVLSNSLGIASFTNLPLGQYRVGVVTASLGDSVQVAAIDSVDVRLKTVPDSVGVVVRLTYPEVSLRQVRTLPIGKKVFVRGVILVGVQAFRDTTSHLADSSGALRLTRVVLRGGLPGNAPGDSVSALGFVSTRLGQPVLDQAVVSRFATRTPPISLPVSTETAATASNGTLDAALVRITSALISNTATISPDYRVTVSDGSGSLNLLLDANINFPRSFFIPGRRVIAQGVLVPDGLGGWSLKPRDPNDVVVF